MAVAKKTHDESTARFFRYVDENNRRVTIAADAIAEVIEAESSVHVNYGDGAADSFEGEVRDKFLKFWEAYTAS